MQPSGNLLTDLYQLNMVEAYLEHGKTDTAVFELFVRQLPAARSFLVAAGLEQALSFLEAFQFRSDEIEWLARSGRFSSRLLDYLGRLRFSGDVHAMPEGSVFFANEPILRITASLPEAQLLETRLTNILHFQTLIASKAARMVLAAPVKLLVDFGLRRAHGGEAGLYAARASYLAGFSGTATVLAGKSFGIPLFGTMAHSFVQAFDDEASAFAAFAESRPVNVVFLIDTYDTVAAARKIVLLKDRLQTRGIAIAGVRIDSGDLIELSKQVRRVLDDGGLPETQIHVSGGLDEVQITEMLRAGAPIDGFGIGTALVTSSDAAALDCAYKLQEYAGTPRRKLSPGKSTWPGRKQVWRSFAPDGAITGDIISTWDDMQPGEALIRPVILQGKRVQSPAALDEMRSHVLTQLANLPEYLRHIATDHAYPVRVSDRLLRLAEQVTGRN